MDKSKNKDKISSGSTTPNNRKKIVNSYGYDVSDFAVLDIAVRRDPETDGVSVQQSSKRTPNDPS